MLSLFKRHRSTPAVSHLEPVFGYTAVSQRVKPMSSVEFEFAQQSLEMTSDWLYHQPATTPCSQASYFVLRGEDDVHYQQALSQSITMGVIPVVFANCHEVILQSLPILANDNASIGVVHIGHHFELKQTLDLQVGSAFHFLLSRFSQANLFCIGIDTSDNSSQTQEYAEDLGCDWVSWDECGFLNRNQLKAQLSGYIEHCEQLVINIDLACLVAENSFDTHRVLDNHIVLRVLRQIALSKKLCHVQLVGARDELIYSKQTKEIVDELTNLAPYLANEK